MSNKEVLKDLNERGGELKPNPINAVKFIESMMNMGYGNTAAICDIIDNSVDAKANNINILIDKKDDDMQIIIMDDGIGMDESTLDQALRFGSETPHEEDSDLGKFGMGLTTAGLSLAEKTTVFTKKEYGDILKGVTDLEEIKKENALVKWLGKADEQEILTFNYLLQNAKSGTIVIFEKCTGVKYKNIGSFCSILTKDVGRIFRKYLDRVNIFINNKKVEANDWLFEGDSRTKVISDDTYEIKWQNKQGQDNIGQVRIKFVLLPAFETKIMREKEIGPKTQGFSILRNNREIAYNVLNHEIGGRVRHASLNRFRGEISFDSSCDYAMGVNFQKNGIEMLDNVANSLRQTINNTINTIARMAMSEKNSELDPEEEDIHNQALDVIEKNQNILVDKPVVKLEKRDKGNEFENELDNKISKEKNNDKDKRVRVAKKFQNKPGIPNAKFEFKEYDRTSNIFFPRLEGKTVVITFNTAHPFYERFIKDNTDNVNLVAAVDYLVYCMGLAQLAVTTEDDTKVEYFEDYMQSISTNMRKFLE